MDNYNDQQQNNSYYDFQDKRSRQMETAALILGIVSIATIITIIPALVCGSLAIILGLLSKGGELTVSSRGSVSIVLGIIGLVLSLIVLSIGIANLDTDNGTRELYEYIEEYETPYSDTI